MSASNDLWTHPSPLLLASGSRTRRDLLATAGILAETLSPEIDERGLERAMADANGEGVASALASAKAVEVSRRRPGRLVLGADQTLTLGSERFHKPANLDVACAQLAQLAGRTHALHAAAALAKDGAVIVSFCDAARLTVRSLDEAVIRAYAEIVGTERLTSSVGGYQFEGLGIHLFERIEGAHSTILGLPLLPLLAHLRELGLLAI